jgi:hypothetical protein
VPNEVFLNASALSPSALYIDLRIPTSADLGNPEYDFSQLSNIASTLVSLASRFNISLRALIDSGSSHCFVSSRIVEINGFKPYSITPITLRYLDGSSSIISEMLRLPILFPSGDVQNMDFYVTRLDAPSDLVLGYNWLRRFNPLIDWSTGNISFRSNVIPDVSLSTSQADMPVLDSENLGRPAENKPSETSSPAPAPSMESSPGPDKPSLPSAFASPPHISLVSAAAYSVALKQSGSTQFILRPIPRDTIGGKSATVKPDLSGLPAEYQDFADVFSEREADTLPPHREYDLHIETEDGQVPPIGHIYSLSQAELSALREFIDTNLKSGFIYPSKSTHGAPILFVKKKDGSLRLCVDYRGLNRVTRKDRYPLPLISDLLDAPGKARIYTKLDLRHAYHLLRVAEGDEPKTAFRTRYGSFNWRVVPFGLTNAPAAFQRFLNTIFADLLDVTVIVYLDDILIYSDDPANHTKHVREVLRRLREAGLYCNLPKCEFSVTTCEYLGYILSPEGFRMAPDKVSAVTNWPTPRKVKDIQSFLGFCNFYRRFIYDYSGITVPLTRLTRSGVKWNWSDSCQTAFDTLKSAFASAPILHHWVPGRQITVETDASDYAIASILSIIGDDGDIHPVAFRSRTLGPSEVNYDVHDKELLAVFDAFTIWRHYLEGSALPIDVVTDHKNLEYFTTTKMLTRRQVRWSETLCQFNLVIRFRPGKLGGKPDALTRRWDVYPKEGDRAYSHVNPHNFRPVFTNEQLSASLRATLLEEPVLRASVIMDVERLHSDIRLHLPGDPVAQIGMKAAKSGDSPRWTIDDSGLLRYDERIWVPRIGESDDLRVRVLQQHHDHILAGHFGQNRTLKIVRREYTWPGVRTFVRDYCRSCVLCKRNKKPRHKPYGLLKPLPVPTRPWDSISMDFIEELPMSGEFNSILVIIDRSSKQGIFIACDIHITAPELARLFLIHVFSKHGVPSHVTSDRGSEFVSHFFRSLGELLNMKLHFTSGYHPSADGQTERANQTLEQYIRMYCSYQQDDWHLLLPLAEFAYNNAPNASTGISPFYANKGYNPSISVHPERDVASSYAKDFAVDLQGLHDFLREQITSAQEYFKVTADRRRIPPPDFKVGDSAYILAKHIRTTRPTPKFSEAYLGPYEIIAKPSANSYTLRLPKQLRSIHPVFHVSQLELHIPNPFPGREPEPPGAVEVDDDGAQFEVKIIVDSKIDRRCRVKLRYYVEWLGYENTDEQYSWIGADDVHAPELIESFHKRYPKKPGPDY